ncbi:MAG: hypothetical protein R3290_08535 [Acidimicrobiia bacterium]|nr:hypothetical protein [Acidimicrobiia bacterium]
MAITSRPVLDRGVRRSWTIALLGVLFAAGVHLDGWAHNHGHVDESFFTPWHAVLYGTFLVLAVTLARPALLRRADGASWAEAVPRRERLALAGIAVFTAGGLGDMLWHTAFGVEEDLEALLSPTHLTLAVGGVFMVTSAYLGSGRASAGGWWTAGPAVLAAAALWSLLGFMTQFMHPLVQLWPTEAWFHATMPFPELGELVGVAGFVFHAVVAALVVLVLARDDRLPDGGIAVLVGLAAVAAVTQGDDSWMALPMIAGGVGMAAAWRMIGGPVAGWRVRVLGALVGGGFVASAIAGMFVGAPVVWSAELWAGAVVGSALLGSLASLAVVAPRIDD